jgi:abelson tyrosine-protein kinase 1
MFIREVKVWKLLKHPNVLELYGASAATSEGPWFFVSPYMRHGSLVSYLRRIADKSGSRSRSRSRTRGNNNENIGPHDTPRAGQELILDYEGVDMVKMMYEIAQGMQYLHSMRVLHGNLKVRPEFDAKSCQNADCWCARALMSLLTTTLNVLSPISDRVR